MTFFLYLLLFLWLSAPDTVCGQGQKTDVKVLEGGDCDWQCPSVEERETMRNEIHQIANCVILAIATGRPHSHLQWDARMAACCFYLSCLHFVMKTFTDSSHAEFLPQSFPLYGKWKTSAYA
jgi:hypothetical protein